MEIYSATQPVPIESRCRAPSVEGLSPTRAVVQRLRFTRYTASMTPLAIPLDVDRLRELCRRYRIRRVSLFGSVLRDDFRRESDVDVLVEFEPNAHIGWDFITIRDELSRLLERKVDLLTPGSIRTAYRQEILSSARTIYASAG